MKHFFVSELLIWRQKWAASVRHSNLPVVRRVSPGRVTVVLFWTKYAVPCQIKPRLLKLTIRGSQSKRLLSRRFGRTAKFWLQFVLWASLHMQGSSCEIKTPNKFKPIPVLHKLSCQAHWELGPVSRKPRKLFGPAMPLLDNLYLNDKRCIRLKLLVWRELLLILTIHE